MKNLFLLCCMAASSMAAAKPPAKECPDAAPGYAFSPPLTIKKIERDQMAAFSHWQKIRPDLPKLPFGFMNAQWVAFKSTMRPGDEIVQFTSDAHSWQHLAGETGYAITRSGCIVKKFTTMVN